MPYVLHADSLAQSKRAYERDKPYHRAKDLKWKDKNPKRYAFLGQRNTSNQRGVEFNLTFEEWVEFWGNDFHKRGRKMYEMVMARYDDKGPYELGNIYKATNAENKVGPRQKDVGLHEDIPL